MKNFESKIQKLTESNKEIHKELAIYHNFCDKFADIIYRLDSKGKIVFINDAVQQYGYKPEDLIGKSMLDLIHPADRKKGGHRILEKRRERRSGTDPVELRLVSKNKTEIPFEIEPVGIFLPFIEIEAFGIYNEEEPVIDNFIGTQGVARNITKRKAYEDALIANEKKFKSLFDFTPIMLHSTGPNGKLLDVNQNWLQKSGYTKEEVFGLKFSNFLSKNSQKKEKKHSKDLFKFGHCEKVEYEFLKKNGEIIEVEFSAFILKDHEGKVLRVIAALEDITEAKLAKSHLKNSEYYLKEAQQTAKLGDWNWNLKTNIIKGSDELFHIFEIVKKHTSLDLFSNFAIKEDSKQLLLKLKDKVSKFKPWKIETRIKMPDGRVKWVKVIGKPVHLTFKKTIEYTGTIQDISENKKIEEQLLQSKKMESIGRMANQIAHDFNNILNSIMGYSEVLLTGSTPQEKTVNNAAEIILKSAEKAKKLTDQLIGFARGEKPDPICLNLNNIINSTLKEQDFLLDKKTRIHPDLKHTPNILGDKNQVKKVIKNLLINATVDLPPDGEIFIETDVVFLDDDFIGNQKGFIPGKYVTMSIKDTGESLDSDARTNIFDPSFSKKNPRGVELAAIYGIINNHGGHISVSSEPGEGTRFSIFLPVTEEKVKNGDTIPALDKHLQILFIDDEEVVRTVTKIQLEQIGHKVVLASDGLQGIKNYQKDQENIDLIILDLVMPKMAGYDTFLALKKINPQVKILLISGFDQSPETSELLEMGAIGFMQKPFALEELRKTLKTFF